MTPRPCGTGRWPSCGALVRIPTVTDVDPAERDEKPFVAFEQELARQFPLLHQHLELVPIPGHALLFHWPGAAHERPVVLMAHIDVVPIDEEAPLAVRSRRCS